LGFGSHDNRLDKVVNPCCIDFREHALPVACLSASPREMVAQISCEGPCMRQTIDGDDMKQTVLGRRWDTLAGLAALAGLRCQP
jgi:hypothetical protein